MNRVSRYLTLSLTFVLTSLVSVVAMAESDNTNLAREIERIEEAQGVKLGISALHLQSGKTFSHRADQAFPLASTYKVPMAALALSRVEKGEMDLDARYTVRLRDYVPWSRITSSFPHEGVELSLYNLLETMMVFSDNTATDAVVSAIGGVEGITPWLRENGITGLRVDRSTVDLLRNYLELEVPEDPSISLVDQVDAWMATVANEDSPEDKRKRYQAVLDDPRDQGTPGAMTQLLAALWTGQLLNAEHSEILRQIMRRCKTGSSRIPGRLPQHVLPVAHKTGTLGGSVNDVGVIEMPGGAGDLVLSIYAQGDAAILADDSASAARGIADAARAVYDRFLY